MREGYITTSDSAQLFYRTMGRGPDTLIAIHGGPGVELESIAGAFATLAAGFGAGLTTTNRVVIASYCPASWTWPGT